MIELRITNQEAIALENLFGLIEALPAVLNNPQVPDEAKRSMVASLLADEKLRSLREKLAGEMDNMAQAQRLLIAEHTPPDAEVHRPVWVEQVAGSISDDSAFVEALEHGAEFRGEGSR